MQWLSCGSPWQACATQADSARLLGLAPNLLSETGELQLSESSQESSDMWTCFPSAGRQRKV